MGIYLSTPSSEVAVESIDTHSKMRIAVGEMQGWRKNMEDAHIALESLTPPKSPSSQSDVEMSLFGVFDGHGGKEVAKFTKIKYAEELVKLPAFQSGDYEKALVDSFHRIDELLEDRQFDSLLRELRALPNPSDLRPSQRPVVSSRDWGAVAAIDDDSDQLGGPGDEDDENEDEDDNVVDSDEQVLNKRKKLSASEAMELIQSLLQKRENEKRSEGVDSPPKEVDSEVLPVIDISGSGDNNAALPPSIESSEVAPSQPTLGVGKKAGISIVVPSDEAIASAAAAASSFDLPKNSAPQGEIIPTFSTTERGARMCKLRDHRLNAGCTAVVVLKVGNKLITANAGDSRSVLCRKDGSAYPLSYDHKPAAPTELSRITLGGGFVNEVGRVNGNLNLSRSLGDLKYKQMKHLERHQHMITAEPDISVTEIEEGDKFFMLACDGVWDVMTCQSACDFVSERLAAGRSPAQIVEDVCHFCLSDDPRKTEGLGGDNMTCMIVQLL